MDGPQICQLGIEVGFEQLVERRRATMEAPRKDGSARAQADVLAQHALRNATSLSRARAAADPERDSCVAKRLAGRCEQSFSQRLEHEVHRQVEVQTVQPDMQPLDAEALR